MILSFRRVIITAAIILMFSEQAFAVLDFQALYGRRWYVLTDADGNETGFAATQTDVALHFDPVPMVPISFGAGYSLFDYDEGDFGETFEKVAGREFGIDITVWVPRVPVCIPYLRLRYAIDSQFEISYVNAPNDETIVKLQGFHATAGLAWGLVPSVNFLTEYSQGVQMEEVDSRKVAGVEQTVNDKPEDYNSQAFLVGLMFGF